MCYRYYYKHTCGHEKEGEFYICTKHKGKDTRCAVVTRIKKRSSKNKCLDCLNPVPNAE